MKENAKCILFTSISEERPPRYTMKRITMLLENDDMSSKLMKFIDEMSQKDDTWRFWNQFVLIL